MDDLQVFENFVLTKCGLTVNRSRNETVGLINSFNALLAPSDAEIGDFLKTTHTMNSDRPENGKILIPASVIFALKTLIFELEDRSCCGALTVLVTLQALDEVQLNYMRVNQKKSVTDEANFYALRNLPEVTVQKLTTDNDEIFTTAFCYVVGKNIGMNNIFIYYVMRGVTGNYDYLWINL